MISKLLRTTAFAALLVVPQVASAQETAPPPASSLTPAAETTPPPDGAASAAQSAPAPSVVEAPPAAPTTTVARPPFRPWFVHLNVGVPVYTTIGSWMSPLGNSVNAQSFTPADRFVLVQLIGVGYWVHPHIRLTLSLQFAETLTSQPANAAMPAGPTTLTGMTFMSAIAWAAFTYGPFFVGAGPMAGPRWMGNSAHNWVFGDFGLFTCIGAALPLGSGYALALAVQVPVTFNPAVNVAIVPALALSRRF